ncbi:MAG: cupredoxin domain-containing protein [Gaiellaceae bacterium]
MTPRAAAVLAAALLALAGCGGNDDEGDSGEPRGSSIKTIQISETDFKLDPSTVNVDEPGVYTLHVVNDGDATHALEAEGEGLETETAELGPGESADLKVELKDGEYELYCPVGDHKDRGMTGSVTVGGGGGTTEESSSSTY